jgi:hypothetical protein
MIFKVFWFKNWLKNKFLIKKNLSFDFLATNLGKSYDMLSIKKTKAPNRAKKITQSCESDKIGQASWLGLSRLTTSILCFFFLNYFFSNYFFELMLFLHVFLKIIFFYFYVDWYSLSFILFRETFLNDEYFFDYTFKFWRVIFDLFIYIIFYLLYRWTLFFRTNFLLM